MYVIIATITILIFVLPHTSAHNQEYNPRIYFRFVRRLKLVWPFNFVAVHLVAERAHLASSRKHIPNNKRNYTPGWQLRDTEIFSLGQFSVWGCHLFFRVSQWPEWNVIVKEASARSRVVRRRKFDATRTALAWLIRFSSRNNVSLYRIECHRNSESRAVFVPIPR